MPILKSLNNKQTTNLALYTEKDDTGNSVIYGFIEDKIVICKEECFKFLKHYIFDEYELYNQEINEILQKKEKKEVLNNQFQLELKKNSNYLSVNKNEAINRFRNALNYIIDIKYQKISIEFTPDSSFFFNIHIMDNYKAHIELFVNSENNNDHFFSLYFKKECIMSGYGMLENIVKEINENV